GITLNIFNNNADRVRMANLAQTVNVLQAVILTKEEKMVLTPTYHVMEMYKVHQDATLVPVQVITNDFMVDGERIPAVSVSASIDKARKMHVSLTNLDNTANQKVELSLNSFKVSKVTGRILTSPKVQDGNTFDNPTKVTPKAFSGATVSGNQLSVDMPKNSVVVLELSE
ncbi:MAG: alpha-N-arabinofuranosidase, partial [Saprospiraceae bacterium]|nr:alpha-N-arabinofuranosidase [Saprospiraceae bacterium]